VLLSEIKYYQKLSLQLPSVVFFPLFEIGTSIVKEEIQRRLKVCLGSVMKTCESSLVVRSEGICEKY
jgi:hypothetical protein